MRKIISLITALTVTALLLSSCEYLAQHDHSFAEELTYDSDYHWNACLVTEECTVMSNRAPHELEVTPNEEGKLVNVCKVCGYTNERVSTAGEHDHVFAESYSNSENFHWFECTVDGCFEISENSEHKYGNPDIVYEAQKIIATYTCVDCGYQKVESITVDSEVDDAVEWITFSRALSSPTSQCAFTLEVKKIL